MDSAPLRPRVPRRRRVLHAIHDFLPRHRAGSEIYVDRLCRALTADSQVTVLAAEHDLTRPDGHLTWRHHDGLPVVELVNNWTGRGFEDTYERASIAARLADVLDAVQPDVVHIHNLLNLSFALPALARARRIPVVATLHDYTLVCPSGGQRVHRADAHVCHDIDVDRCARCFGESPFQTLAVVGRASALARPAGLTGGLMRRAGAMAAFARRRAPGLATRVGEIVRGASMPSAPTPAQVERRLARARDIFRQIDLVVAPSRSMATQIAALGLSGPQVEVSDYGFAPMAPHERRAFHPPLRFGFMGTLVWHKGVHVLIEAARALPVAGWQIEIHGDEQVFPDYSATLRAAASGLPIRFCGGYDHGRVHEIISRFDALVVPSIWLENSPLVIHEAFMAGVPVIGSRIGGTADLVQDAVNGRLYDAHSAPDLARVLGDVVARPDQLRRLSSRVPPVKSIDDDADAWRRRYDEVCASGSARGDRP